MTHLFMSCFMVYLSLFLPNLRPANVLLTSTTFEFKDAVLTENSRGKKGSVKIPRYHICRKYIKELSNQWQHAAKDHLKLSNIWAYLSLTEGDGVDVHTGMRLQGENILVGWIAHKHVSASRRGVRRKANMKQTLETNKIPLLFFCLDKGFQTRYLGLSYEWSHIL